MDFVTTTGNAIFDLWNNFHLECGARVHKLRVDETVEEATGREVATPGWIAPPYNHYPMMTLDEIKALDVSSIAADDCALFLAATWPMEAQAHEEGMGLHVRDTSHMGQKKQTATVTGSNRNETLLVGKKGKILAPAPGTRQRQGSHREAFGQA